MRRPTDEEIAEEISLLSERARADKKSLKRKREADAEEKVSARMDGLEAAQEQMSETLSRLERMVSDLHAGRFGKKKRKSSKCAEKGCLQVSDDTEVVMTLRSAVPLEKVDPPSPVGGPNNAVGKEAVGADPSDLGGASNLKDEVSSDEHNPLATAASNTALELETLARKSSERVVTDTSQKDQEILKDIGAEAASDAIPTRNEEVDRREKGTNEVKPNWVRGFRPLHHYV